MSFSEIRKLSPYQVKHVLFRDESDDAEERAFQALRRGEKSHQSTPAALQDLGPLKGENVSQKAIFYKLKHDLGMTRDEIDREWELYEKAQALKEKSKQ